MTRRLARLLGTLMIAGGLALLGWSLAVWLWEDPFTALYTRYEQRGLAASYDRLERAYRPPTTPPRASLAAQRRQIALAARRYRAAADRGSAIGRLTIARIDLSMVVVEGTDTDTLKKGPGRDRRTYMPGQGELVYVAGHRTTYSAPFSDIDDLRPGDRVTLRLPYATFVYEVSGHVIVPANDLDRLRSRGREVLALQACHPRFFASHRYIVYARPVQLVPRGGVAYTLPGASAQGSVREVAAP